jgi:hypothetical protein
MRALVIIVDEYAELADDAPEATSDADSIARRGRAVAVTLIAATQRPTQKAMGQGALRSQTDVRISFRVRERKDVDLILGQGMLSAGWHAHTLNAPGMFLISAPGRDIPTPSAGMRASSATAQAPAPTRPSRSCGPRCHSPARWHLGAGPDERYRHGPPLGVLPPPRTARHRPRHPDPARELAHHRARQLRWVTATDLVHVHASRVCT